METAQKTAMSVTPKVNDKWYNIRPFYGRENPRKFGNGIFGCIPHARGALSKINKIVYVRSSFIMDIILKKGV